MIGWVVGLIGGLFVWLATHNEPRVGRRLALDLLIVAATFIALVALGKPATRAEWRMALRRALPVLAIVLTVVLFIEWRRT